MKTIGDFFCSRAKTEILRVLHHHPNGVQLRELARLAGVYVRSAELALDSLVNEGLVVRKRAANRVVYVMKEQHPDVPVLAAIFDAAALAAIRVNRQTLDTKAKRILPFIRQARRMLDHARGSRHDA